MSPTKWQTAYLQSEFELDTPEVVQIRISTSDPLKVWVDGALAYQTRTNERYVVDNVVLPALHLGKGRHRILVKSMNETGEWLLRIRLTDENGGELATAVREITSIADMQNPNRQDATRARSAPPETGLPSDSEVYTRFVRAERLLSMGEKKTAVEQLQKFNAQHPDSLLVSTIFALALLKTKREGKRPTFEWASIEAW